jgi:hypothetical protein
MGSCNEVVVVSWPFGSLLLRRLVVVVAGWNSLVSHILTFFFIFFGRSSPEKVNQPANQPTNQPP